MTPGDLAALHACCFVQPRPWSGAEFAALLDNPHVFLLTRPRGFLMGRLVADEAELLTLAVAPEARRQGIGRGLLRDFAATSRAGGATRAFLEVAADNAAACRLYRREGWRETGQRRNYYGPGLNAIVMLRHLDADEEGS